MAYDLYIGLLHKQLSYATANGPWTCTTPKNISHKRTKFFFQFCSNFSIRLCSQVEKSSKNHKRINYVLNFIRAAVRLVIELVVGSFRMQY